MKTPRPRSPVSEGLGSTWRFPLPNLRFAQVTSPAWGRKRSGGGGRRGGGWQRDLSEGAASLYPAVAAANFSSLESVQSDFFAPLLCRRSSERPVAEAFPEAVAREEIRMHVDGR